MRRVSLLVSSVLLPASLLALVGCTPPVEAPEDFGELTRFLFANFDTETGAEMQASVEGLESFFATVDLEAGPRDRAVTLPKLNASYHVGVTAPAGTDPAAQVPVGLVAKSRHDLDASIDLMVQENQVCIGNNSYKYYRRRYAGDTACFVDGSCDRAEAEAEIRYESLIANIWYDEFQNIYRVELDDGRTMVLMRSWIEQEFLSDNGSSSWRQRYAVNVWLPDADDASTTWRFLAFWSEANLALADDAYANLVADGMQENYDNEDNFVDDIMCPNDRDAEPARD